MIEEAMIEETEEIPEKKINKVKKLKKVVSDEASIDKTDDVSETKVKKIKKLKKVVSDEASIVDETDDVPAKKVKKKSKKVDGVSEKKIKKSKPDKVLVNTGMSMSDATTFVFYDDSDAEAEAANAVDDEVDDKSGSGISSSRGDQDIVLKDEDNKSVKDVAAKPKKKKAIKHLIIPIKVIGSSAFECVVEDDDDDEDHVTTNNLSRYAVNTITDNDGNTHVINTKLVDVYCLSNAALADTIGNFPELGAPSTGTSPRASSSKNSPVTCWTQKSTAREHAETGVIVPTEEEVGARFIGSRPNERRVKKTSDEDAQDEADQQYEASTFAAPKLKPKVVPVVTNLEGTTSYNVIPHKSVPLPKAFQHQTADNDMFENGDEEFEDEEVLMSDVEEEEEEEEEEEDFVSEDLGNLAYGGKAVVGKARYGRSLKNEIGYV
jgi:hypothetical protein